MFKKSFLIKKIFLSNVFFRLKKAFKKVKSLVELKKNKMTKAQIFFFKLFVYFRRGDWKKRKDFLKFLKFKKQARRRFEEKYFVFEKRFVYSPSIQSMITIVHKKKKNLLYDDTTINKKSLKTIKTEKTKSKLYAAKKEEERISGIFNGFKKILQQDSVQKKKKKVLKLKKKKSKLVFVNVVGFEEVMRFTFCTNASKKRRNQKTLTKRKSRLKVKLKKNHLKAFKTFGPEFVTTAEFVFCPQLFQFRKNKSFLLDTFTRAKYIHDLKPSKTKYFLKKKKRTAFNKFRFSIFNSKFKKVLPKLKKTLRNVKIRNFNFFFFFKLFFLVNFKLLYLINFIFKSKVSANAFEFERVKKSAFFLDQNFFFNTSFYFIRKFVRTVKTRRPKKMKRILRILKRFSEISRILKRFKRLRTLRRSIAPLGSRSFSRVRFIRFFQKRRFRRSRLGRLFGVLRYKLHMLKRKVTKVFYTKMNFGILRKKKKQYFKKAFTPLRRVFLANTTNIRVLKFFHKLFYKRRRFFYLFIPFQIDVLPPKFKKKKKKFKLVRRFYNFFRYYYLGLTAKKLYKISLVNKSKLLAGNFFTYLNLFELRLDVLAFRFGLTKSIQEAGFLIKNGLFSLNGRLHTVAQSFLNFGQILNISIFYKKYFQLLILNKFEKMLYINRAVFQFPIIFEIDFKFLAFVYLKSFSKIYFSFFLRRKLRKVITNWGKYKVREEIRKDPRS